VNALIPEPPHNLPCRDSREHQPKHERQQRDPGLGRALVAHGLVEDGDVVREEEE
jgi:hypothetical protein